MDFDINEPTYQKGVVVFQSPSFVVKGDFLVASLEVPHRTDRIDVLPLSILCEWELESNFPEWLGGYSSSTWQDAGYADVEKWMESGKYKDSVPWKELNEWNQIEVIHDESGE